MPPRASARLSSNPFAKTSIAMLAAHDLLASDDDTDITLVDPPSLGDDEEEEYYNPKWHKFEEDSSSEEEDSSSGSKSDSEDETDDEDDEEDEYDDEPNVPSKRKRRTPSPAPERRKISYTVSIYTALQLKKPKSSRGPPVTDVFEAYSDAPWERLEARIGKHIRTALDPMILDYDDYKITFTVPRQVTDPIALTGPTKYKLLVTNALNIKKSPGAKILVEQKPGPQDKENDEPNDARARKGARKTKIRNERDILPGNEALNEKIGQLRARWVCPTPGGPCGSEHCFVNPTDPEHFPLGHTHMESWGAAMLKGPEFADVNKPPNNDLFDKLSPQALAARSPLLQRRLELNQKPAPQAPQININFPAELATLLRPAPAPLAAAPVLAAPPPPQPLPAANMLIPAHLAAGLSLSVDDFCRIYDLDDDICARFKKFKYKTTDTFVYIAMVQLATMEFMPGEIAELQVAIAKWGVAL
ncbi:hypothetical protein C8R47DRAFT_1102179 [Mycena vitilis]|nr:hypothetical protein C8R47DRAFT_1102179 [Mycena vitilis]